MGRKLLCWLFAFVPLLASAAEADLILFNGQNLDGWIVEGPREFKEGDTVQSIWEVCDGKIVCRGRGFGFLRFEREFSDFRLHLEYRFQPPDAAIKRGRGNSGVGIRTGAFDPKKSRETRPSFFAYEVQLFDDPPGKMPDKHSNVSLYRYVAPRTQATKPAPEWNAVEIECVGPRVNVKLNGIEVIDVDQTTVPEIREKPLRGFVCLQNHGSPVEFRNIRIQDLAGQR